MFTLYYKDKNNNRIAIYTYSDYKIAVEAYKKAIQLAEFAEHTNGIISWHLINDNDETVLF